jgi:threonine/homoserine/homoserine lactone efflux protein
LSRDCYWRLAPDYCNREEIQTSFHDGKANLSKAFFQGSLTTLLNPKVALFYVAFLPQFVAPTRGPIPLQLFILGLLFNITSLAVDTTQKHFSSVFGM